MWRIFLCQNPFPAISRRKNKQKIKNKVPMTTKPREGGKGLSGRTTKKNFFAASLRDHVKKKVFSGASPPPGAPYNLADEELFRTLNPALSSEF